MEELLLRIVPGLSEQWKGATPDAIAQIERIAGRPLPSFYRWFLNRMGQSMGPLAYPTLDFSAQRVLSCYAKKLVVPEQRFLLIAYESDEVMPLHLFYDFTAPAREDALVTTRAAQEGELSDDFETLREMLAWGAFSLFRVEGMPQMCSGSLKGNDPDFLSDLDLLMSSLGFTSPISTGPLCRLYERHDATMICRGTPRAGRGNRRTFNLGGRNAGTLRRILGEITTQSSLEVKVKDWAPALR
ncbi:SMI1/KNR4 family protein [Archangium violaceum]|uniref:SMI1/KNR4 family protein n=1 Tax=Archangium violaceum TaxID=83451 RepID=UPI00193C3BBE|nr:SMI1/KNR4 family protein [Archangium violaceum]QRK12598.1 SMI1/KNR4 family protein [Archangium violaceum]